MPADVRLAMLAALSFGPQNGYGLRQRIGEIFAPFFTASQGALYPAIGKALAAGEISEDLSIDTAGTSSSLDKRRFFITETGVQVLNDRLSALRGTEATRSDFLIAMTMAHFLTEEEILRLVDERIAELHGMTRSTIGTTTSGGQFVRRYQQAISRAAIEFLKGEGQAILRAELRDRTER